MTTSTCGSSAERWASSLMTKPSAVGSVVSNPTDRSST
jgi:hypothetical protein